MLPIEAAIQLHKWLKQLLQIFRGNSNPIINNGELNQVTLYIGLDL